jgi:hypothetical protein
MPTPINQQLYDLVKQQADKIYEKPSAYKSGWIVRNYKLHGGEYLDDGKPKNLKKWFQSEWKDINPNKTSKSYPVYRPTKYVKGQPLPYQYVEPSNLKKQIKLKQKYKGMKNLPPFQYII